MHHISRSIPADLEIARRENISVAELLAFAVVPDVAPVHLLVHRRAPSPPRDAGADGDAGPGPGVDTRHEPLPGTDRRVFLTEVPDRVLPRSMRP